MEKLTIVENSIMAEENLQELSPFSRNTDKTVFFLNRNVISKNFKKWYYYNVTINLNSVIRWTCYLYSVSFKITTIISDENFKLRFVVSPVLYFDRKVPQHNEKIVLFRNLKLFSVISFLGLNIETFTKQYLLLPNWS